MSPININIILNVFGWPTVSGQNVFSYPMIYYSLIEFYDHVYSTTIQQSEFTLIFFYKTYNNILRYKYTYVL